MISYLWSELTRRDKVHMLGAWCMGLLLSLCMVLIGRKISFWADHASELHLRPFDVCADVLPWLVTFGLLSWTRVYLSALTSARLETHLHERLMHHALSSFPTPHNILNRFVSDIPTIADTMTHQVAMGVRHVFFCAASLVMMWITSPTLTICIMAAVPVMVIPFVWQLSRLKQTQKSVHMERDHLTRFVEECMNNIVTIQAFSQENETFKKWRIMLKGFSQRINHHGMQRAFVGWWVITGAGLGVFGIIMTGAQYVSITTGDMMSFIFYAVLCVGGLTALNNTYREISVVSVAVDRLHGILSTPLHHTPSQRRFSSTTRGTVACHHVHFAYPNHRDHEVLKGVTFSVMPGELTALVGKSGAGKSTLLSLLLRFYAPQKGTIHIDGVDIQKVDIKALRERIGYVGQEPVLFDGTIYDNIVYGKPNASRKEVYAVIEETGVGGFLDKWPKQEYTKVQDIALSGGQKQCVALARALIRRPSLFLLDEPTNALDAENESLIQGAFRRVTQQHTTIMIAHRLSTVVGAHKILVLDDGVVKAEGTHGELVSHNELYQRFVSQQFPACRVSST